LLKTLEILVSQKNFMNIFLGIPPVIYLTMNKSIQRDCLLMYKQMIGKPVSTIHPMTAGSHAPPLFSRHATGQTSTINPQNIQKLGVENLAKTNDIANPDE